MIPASGRGRGRNTRGRFGRGRSNPPGRSTITTTKSEPEKKTPAEYKYALDESNKSTCEFSEVTRYLMNHIGNTFTHGDIVEQALEEKKEYDFDAMMPVKKVSKSSSWKKKVMKQFLTQKSLPMRFALP
jgi:hypothetical protein